VPSLLPGMDPYLEDPKLWGIFHRHMVAALYQTLLPGLVDRYRARVSARSYRSEVVLFTSVTKEQHDEEYIEIRNRTDGRLVTLVEVVSMGNRTTTAGRLAYQATRSAAQAERAGCVEFDLLTQGSPPIDFDRSSLPPHDTTVTVTRGGTPNRYEIYTSGVRRRLPKFKLPLSADDRDTILDLQLAFVRAYETGQFEKLINYAGPLPPDVRLNTEDRDWLHDLVQASSQS
jgi:hypothetical protein